MIIADTIPMSTIDYPNHLATVVFLQGCIAKCPYCFVPHLRDRHVPGKAWEEVFPDIQHRRHMIDAIVFTGGEPLLHDLTDALEDSRNIGLKTGLYTSGLYPRRLEEILHLLDYVNLSLKAPPWEYFKVTGIRNSFGLVLNSFSHILKSGVEYSITTVEHQGFTEFDREVIQSIVGPNHIFVPLYRGKK